MKKNTTYPQPTEGQQETLAKEKRSNLLAPLTLELRCRRKVAMLGLRASVLKKAM